MAKSSSLPGSAYFYIPDFSMFAEGNPYILSENTFNCRIAPSDDTVSAVIWYGMKCYELSEHVSESSSPKSEEGLSELCGFIDREYEEYMKKVSSGEVAGRRTYKPRTT